jgi:hypothetical protein
MAVEKKTPAGLRKVFGALKEEIGATKEPHAVAKALVPMLRDHVAKLKEKATPKRPGAGKVARPAAAIKKTRKTSGAPVRRRAARRAAVAEAADTAASAE